MSFDELTEALWKAGWVRKHEPDTNSAQDIISGSGWSAKDKSATRAIHETATGRMFVTGEDQQHSGPSRADRGTPKTVRHRPHKRS